MSRSHPLAALRRQLSISIRSNWFSRTIVFAICPSAALIGIETQRRALYATKANGRNVVALDDSPSIVPTAKAERIDTRFLPTWCIL